MWPGLEVVKTTVWNNGCHDWNIFFNFLKLDAGGTVGDMLQKSNQSVNDTKAHPKSGQVDYEFKFLTSMRKLYTHAQALSNRPNKSQIG